MKFITASRSGGFIKNIKPAMPKLMRPSETDEISG